MVPVLGMGLPFLIDKGSHFLSSAFIGFQTIYTSVAWIALQIGNGRILSQSLEVKKEEMLLLLWARNAE